MDEVIVHLKPLGPSHSIVRDVIVQAHSWIGKPPSIMGDEDSLLMDHFVEDFNQNHWDCDGCPPPFFALPPPPRPPFLTVEGEEELCTKDTSPYETCDNPIIIDSHFHTSNELLNIILIVIFAFLLVGIILVIAFIIWRKRVNLLSPFRGKSRHHGSSSSTLPVDPNRHHHQLHPDHQMGFQKSDFPFFNPQQSHKPSNTIELAEHPLPVSSSTNRHVYSNPNYPTLEIGGLPFYLMPAGDVVGGMPSHLARGGPVSSPLGALSKDTSLTSPAIGASPPFSVGVGHHLPIQSQFSALNQSPQIGENHFYEPSSSSVTSSRGPIYEDIDRMCSYRGAPPEPLTTNQEGLPKPEEAEDLSSTPLGGCVRNNLTPDAERTYCNVMPASKSPNKKGSRPDSSGSTSSPVPCGTSSSEVSFDSGSSPRHNIVVNPMSPQALSRIRGMSPTPSERTRSPNSVYAAKLASQTRSPGGKSSVYYYSDTLRPRTNRGFTDSDSGISNNRSTSEDTPPPPLPSQRLHIQPRNSAVSNFDHQSPTRSSKSKPKSSKKSNFSTAQV